MKDQYFGDVDDYKKHSILKTFSRVSRVSISLCWMYTEDDNRKDGRRIEYLNSPQTWRKYDPEVFDLLHRKVVVEKQRKLALVEENDLIPNAKYYASKLADQIEERERYFDEFARVVGSADLILFDPDNGLEASSIKKGRKNSSKYIYQDEISRFYTKGHSIMVYQHFPRVNRNEYESALAIRMMRLLDADFISALRTPHAVFLLIHQKQHHSRLQEGVNAILNSWPDRIIITQYSQSSEFPNLMTLQPSLFS